MYMVAIGAAVVVVGVLALIGVLSRLYRKAAADEAIIRTGVGGQKVCIDGAIIAMPSFHQISRVSLSTIRLHVQRVGRRDSLVTKDKIRANVVVEFYLRVQAERDAVLAAARSLGSRGMSNESMKELFEGKVTDALRSVAANQRSTSSTCTERSSRTPWRRSSKTNSSETASSSSRWRSPTSSRRRSKNSIRTTCSTPRVRA
jgi:uncharacterized membrane protein YqiK